MILIFMIYVTDIGEKYATFGTHGLYLLIVKSPSLCLSFIPSFFLSFFYSSQIFPSCDWLRRQFLAGFWHPNKRLRVFVLLHWLCREDGRALYYFPWTSSVNLHHLKFLWIYLLELSHLNLITWNTSLELFHLKYLLWTTLIHLL